MRDKMFLSVIIPCYNEAENLKRGVLSEVRDYLNDKGFSWEVLVSDDGSTDQSKEIVKGQMAGWRGFRHLLNPHGGKPSALWYGIKAARGKWVLFSDMDQSTPIKELDKLLPSIRKGVGAVIGSRGIGRENFPIYRRIGAAMFLLMRQAMLLREIKDTQCGFKMFDRKVVEKAFGKLEFFRREQRTVGWKVTSYDVELLHIIKRMGYKIREVVVDWQDRDVSTNKGGGWGRYVRESKEMLGQILRVKMNDWKGFY